MRNVIFKPSKEDVIFSRASDIFKTIGTTISVEDRYNTCCLVVESHPLEIKNSTFKRRQRYRFVLFFNSYNKLSAPNIDNGFYL